MAKKVTITLDDEILAFVDRQAAASGNKANRSAYINAVLAQVRQQYTQEELRAAYQRDAQDAVYREEVALWDIVVGDGIDA